MWVYVTSRSVYVTSKSDYVTSKSVYVTSKSVYVTSRSVLQCCSLNKWVMLVHVLVHRPKFSLPAALFLHLFSFSVFPTSFINSSHHNCDLSKSTVFFPADSGVVAVATGFREFGDCAVFTDHDLETCAEVTSSDNPLDFILNANVSKWQNTANVSISLRDGECSDNNQVIIVVRVHCDSYLYINARMME